MESAGLYRLAGGTAAVFSARSPDRETANEDSAVLIPVGEDAAVLAVADGVGGLPGGAEASAMVMAALIRRVGSGIRDASRLRDAILTALEEANRSIIARGMGSATTLALAEVHADSLRTYHVGDSMILVTGGNGRVKVETVSHSPVGYAVESGLLSESEAIFHGERHLVSNVIGSPDLHISVGVTTPFSARDTLLLATDGLVDNVEKQEVVQMMRKRPLAACSKTLTDLALRRMSGGAGHAKPDDLTVILYRRQPRRQAG
jgi:serine/threonine protein phosphatase PrpC